MGFLKSNKLVIQRKEFKWVPETKDKLVGFNLKFDLHWAKRCGFHIDDHLLWDCQYAHFILTNQKNRYPSLNEVAEYYGFPLKIDKVKEEFWDNGIDTPVIPEELMVEYLSYDLELTHNVYKRQYEDFKARPKLYNLFLLGMRDLQVLREMEWNGLTLDLKFAKELGEKTKKEIDRIEEQLQTYVRIPGASVNWDSPKQLNSFLFGGPISYFTKEMVGFFKNGNPRIKNIEREWILPKLYDPVGELMKSGIYGTSEDILVKLGKGAAALLLERSTLVKLWEYCDKLPQKIVDMDWPAGELHGSFNQCVAATGRLSSSDPNLQNLDSRFLQAIKSRYS